MTSDIKYPEEIQTEALFKPITIRNFNIKVLKDIKILATLKNKSLSDTLNSAAKEYTEKYLVKESWTCKEDK